MNDKELNQFDDRAFDSLLGDLVDSPPPNMATEVNPWRTAMNRAIWGVGLYTMTIHIWHLDVIMLALGAALMVLGFRPLRRENGWFRAAYITGLLRLLGFAVSLFWNSTAYCPLDPSSELGTVHSLVMIAIGFIQLLALRNGIRSVQKKTGLPPHGGTGILIWYAIITFLALIRFEGFSLWLMLIAYIALLRGLYKLSSELDEAGYVINPAPVRFSDRAVAIGCAGLYAALLFIGYTFFDKYPMDWQTTDSARSAQAQTVAGELLGLGFPECVLEDMTEEEILACDGAVFVICDQMDYDVSRQGRPVYDSAFPPQNLYNGISEKEGERQLRTTYVGVKFADEQEHWKIIQHFEWLVPTEFRGTEAIQLWPGDHSVGWTVADSFSGRVLYDRDGVTYASDYHILDRYTYTNTDMASIMLGKYTSRDVFAGFSMPDDGSAHRGYVIFDLLEMQDGYLVDCWFNYIHQTSKIQYPVQTAIECEMTGSSRNGLPFRTIQTTFRFTTHEEVPKLRD